MFEGVDFSHRREWGIFGPKLASPAGMNFSDDWLQLTPGGEAAGGNVNRPCEGEKSGTEAPHT